MEHLCDDHLVGMNTLLSSSTTIANLFNAVDCVNLYRDLTLTHSLHLLREHIDLISCYLSLLITNPTQQLIYILLEQAFRDSTKFVRLWYA